MKVVSPFRFVRFAVIVLSLAGAAIGCSGYGGGGGGAYGGGGGGGGTAQDCSSTPTHSSPYIVQMNLTFSACNDTTFGVIAGISDTNSTSNIIKVAASQQIQITNIDSTYMHSFDYLGPWTGSFPADNSVATASAASTAITTPTFSTGQLNHGQGSATYSTGSSTGMFVFGDRNYSSVRTVVIVQ